MAHIVFICTGNICRSPMAEGILKSIWQQSGKTGLTVTSMGTHGLDSKAPSENAVAVCMEHSIDISSHRSRPLIIAELESADLILSMERIHKEFLYIFFPQVKDKSFLLGAWPAPETRKSTIKDPYNSSLKTYREVYDGIAGHVQRIIPFVETFLFK